ncbi:hypothetical protein [Lentilactobacillus kosonis]|uniref:Uncharacterized protein n=1 Tax=Lentilactobacillus kosonis TaxID=2810561 RepID=A0A401FNQ3_9LACO|nr:hypothetical protein [Lentilactobacillus kosonis]GAY74025.1 hypothetical protein NBRC111893_2171 [Lentilactobacillus kosonis]
MKFQAMVRVAIVAVETVLASCDFNFEITSASFLIEQSINYGD